MGDELERHAQNAEGSLAEILSDTVLMARDAALIGGSVERARQGTPAAHAVQWVTDEYIGLFRSGGSYLAERVTDLVSVRDRVISLLLGLPTPGLPLLTGPSVVVARDLSPADTAAVDLRHVRAIVTEEGGPTGHTAIVAGQLGLPCVVRAAGAFALEEGTLVTVDAAAGTVLANPDATVQETIAARARTWRALAESKGPGRTSDGHTMQLLANIGTTADAERLADGDCEGVGLLRTEVLYLDREAAPSPEEQNRTYQSIIKALGGQKLVLDAGAEENPALGVRGFRMERTQDHLLRAQLEAIPKAGEATGSPPWVMAPMVATVDEARRFAEQARAAGIGDIGVMIEIPAAALRARQILAEVDFVSLGTNDLAQYTMTADRLLGELGDLLDPWQPAVLDLVATTADAGRELSKPVGVCGESAADPVMALVLIGLGVASLSMAPPALPAVRFALAGHTAEQCRRIAQRRFQRAGRTAGCGRARGGRSALGAGHRPVT
ncbi:putative PEP-binding protein [Streptomyces sp. NPDC059517]|uniref:putative PEP-binding protein n=1 Tax=Streptomyces sp. NPDC059517 TaxID=3346855 RepID=UPI0036749AEA